MQDGLAARAEVADRGDEAGSTAAPETPGADHLRRTPQSAAVHPPEATVRPDPDTSPDEAVKAWGWDLTIGAVVAAVVLSIWLTSAAWGARPPAGDDVQGHLVRASWGLHHAILALRLDSWFPRFMAGHQEYLLYGPGFDWVLALIRAATFGQLSDAGAMKAVEILSCAALVPGAFYLARSFGFSRAAAATGGVLVLAVNSPFGVGYISTFTIGLVPEQVAAPFFLFAFGALWRVLTRPSVARRDRLVAVASCIALVLSHPISVLVLAVIFVVTAAPRLLAVQLSPAQLGRLARIGIVAGGLTAFWLVPYVVHRDLRGPIATWATPTLAKQLGDIWAGHLLFGHVVGALAVAAVAITMVMAIEIPGLRLPGEAAWAALGYLLVAHADIHVQPGSDQALILANRGLGYAGILAALVLGWWLAAASDGICRAAVHGVGVARRNAALVQATTAGAGLAVATGLVVSSLHGRVVAHQAPQPVPALADAATAIDRFVPPTGRFAVERDFPSEIGRTGVTQPNLWLANHSSRNELNVFNGESTASAGVGYLPDEVHTGRPAQLADRLGDAGATDLVTVNPATALRYANSPRWTLLWQEGPLAILRLTPRSGQPDPSMLVTSVDPIQAAWISTSIEHPRWQLAAGGPTTVTVALADLPKWHARIDGHHVATKPSPAFHLIEVDVPAGSHRLGLDYRADRADLVGRLITLVTIAALIAAGFATRRRSAIR